MIKVTDEMDPILKEVIETFNDLEEKEKNMGLARPDLLTQYLFLKLTNEVNAVKGHGIAPKNLLEAVKAFGKAINSGKPS